MTTASRKNVPNTENNTEKETQATTKVTPEKLALAVSVAVDKKFSVTLDTKEQRIVKKVAYAAREILRKNILELAGNNFSQKMWDKIFDTIFGEPNNLKYSPEMMAQMMAIIYPDIPTKPQAAVQFLIDYCDSLTEHNKKPRKQDDDLSDIESLLEDEDLIFDFDDDSEDELDILADLYED